MLLDPLAGFRVACLERVCHQRFLPYVPYAFLAVYFWFKFQALLICTGPVFVPLAIFPAKLSCEQVIHIFGAYIQNILSRIT